MLVIVFSETTCYFQEKKSIILFNSYFSFYFFQNLTNFDIDSYMFVCLQQTYALFDYAYKTNISRNSKFKYGLSLKVIYISVLTSEKLVIFFSKSKLLLKNLFKLLAHAESSKKL